MVGCYGLTYLPSSVNTPLYRQIGRKIGNYQVRAVFTTYLLPTCLLWIVSRQVGRKKEKKKKEKATELTTIVSQETETQQKKLFLDHLPFILHGALVGGCWFIVAKQLQGPILGLSTKEEGQVYMPVFYIPPFVIS